MAANAGDNKAFLSDLIKRHMLMLGPNISLDVVHGVSGLSVSNEGEVIQISGDPRMVTKAVVNEFLNLSGKTTQMTLEKLAEIYPEAEFQ